MSAFNLQTSLRLEGPLDEAILQRGLDALARRQGASVVLRVVDLRGSNDPDDAACQIASVESQRSVDVASGPWCRATLLRLRDEDYQLLLNTHRAIVDRRSVSFVVAELGALYDRYRNDPDNLSSPRVEQPLLLNVAAATTADADDDRRLDEDVRYWRTQLHGLEPLSPLADAALATAADARAMRAATILRSIESVLAGALRRTSEQHDMSRPHILLTAFHVILGRLSGQREFAIGVHGMDAAPTRALLAGRVEPLPIRARLHDELRFTDAVAHLATLLREAEQHRAGASVWLVDEMGCEDGLSGVAHTDVLFDYRPSEPPPGFTSLVVRDLAIDGGGRSPSRLGLVVRDPGRTLDLRLDYQETALSPEMASVLLDQYEYLLEQVAADPGLPLHAYSLRSVRHAHVLPDPRRALPERRYDSVVRMFVDQVRAGGDRSAVTRGRVTWTYKHLYDAALDLSCALRAQGVGPGDVVGVRGARSIGLVASSLGTLMSGGALLLIDPGLPYGRQQLMARTARVHHVLDVASPGALEPIRGATAVNVDPDTCVFDRWDFARGEEAGIADVSPDDPAYVVFTSGTTGQPKGVLGCHKGLSRFLSWQREAFAVTSEDRSAQLTSLSFDVIMRDLFMPLCSGATLCLPETDADAASPPGFLRRSQITLLHTVPSLGRAWLADASPSTPVTSLRCVFFAGEILKHDFVARWRRELAPHAVIVNLYGPAEATLANFFHIVPDAPAAQVVPVGFPLPGTQGLVLRADGVPTGIGEPGEVVIRTPFLSLGYLGGAAGQDSRFQRNPFSGDDRDGVYFTGDHGCIRPDGSLAVLGRMDAQIKIRGIRVEPGEVQHLLETHPAIHAAVVVALDDEAGDKRLVAYIVPRTGRVPVAGLRVFLEQQLPRAMIPSAFVEIDRLPLTANGKLDRRALPAPAPPAFNAARLTEPRTPTERRLTEIWAAALRTERIGVHDDFFDLGGDSLVAMRLVALSDGLFDINDVFAYPSIEALALRIDQRTRPTTAHGIAHD